MWLRPIFSLPQLAFNHGLLSVVVIFSFRSTGALHWQQVCLSEGLLFFTRGVVTVLPAIIMPCVPAHWLSRKLTLLLSDLFTQISNTITKTCVTSAGIRLADMLHWHVRKA
jgi:hypothetical protein